MTVKRFDSSALPTTRAERTPAGWLKAPAFLTRVGVFDYRLGDGKVRREYRPAEEVFHADSLTSFAMVPLTDLHPDPREAPEGLTAENVRKYQVGHVGESVHADGDKVSATVMVTDAKSIERVLKGRTQLSCGYSCDCEETPGEWNGIKYDAVQRNIRGNHVALVDVGRAGPEVRLRLDGDGAMTEAQPTSPAEAGLEEKHMKVVINGKEIEVADEIGKHISGLEAQVKGHQDSAGEVTKVRADADKAQARADALERQTKTLEEKVKELSDPKRMSALVENRATLLHDARRYCGADFKADGMDESGIKVAVLKRLDPEAKLDGKSADYVDAAYEYATKFRSKGKAEIVVRVDDEDADGVDENPVAKLAREVSQMCEKSMERKPAGSAE